MDSFRGEFRKDLSERGIIDLSESLGEEILSSEVQNVDLSSNHLVYLPENVSRFFSNLTELDLAENALLELPPEFCELKELRVLNLKRNRLKCLPRGFGNLKNLREINMSGNRFQHLPEQLCCLDTLQDLHLGGNSISYITPNIKKLKSLDYLYLGGNQLEELPMEMGELSNLTALILCDNKITHLPSQLTNLSNLRSLLLHDNCLQTLPQNLIKLVHLEELSLRNNPLVIRFIKEWPNNVPSLLEIAGNTVKKCRIPYSVDSLPEVLVSFLNKAQQCDNPKCKGVYFNPHFQTVKFVDFCGKYRVPLLQYLCSPMCLHSESCRYGHDCGSSCSSEEEDCAAASKVKKVLLG